MRKRLSVGNIGNNRNNFVDLFICVVTPEAISTGATAPVEKVFKIDRRFNLSDFQDLAVYRFVERPELKKFKLNVKYHDNRDMQPNESLDRPFAISAWNFEEGLPDLVAEESIRSARRRIIRKRFPIFVSLFFFIYLLLEKTIKPLIFFGKGVCIHYLEKKDKPKKKKK